MNYFRAFRTIIPSPKVKAGDTQWLETVPRSDYLAAQDIVLLHLQKFLAEDHPLDRPALGALMNIEERCRASISALTQQYVKAKTMPPSIDDRLWNSVFQYHALLAQAYQRFLHRCLQSPAELPHELPQLLLNIMDCRCHLLKWRYFRYQAMEDGEWLRLHQLYRLAEKEGCATLPLCRYRNQDETTIGATYLRALMLGTLPPSDMLKHETEMVAGWLSDWCGLLSMSDTYEVTRHLFYVDLDQDMGGRRTRKLQPVEHFRYWDTDALVAKIARAHVELQQGLKPGELAMAQGARWPDCQPLLEYLLGAWSRTRHQRQRRVHGRSAIGRVLPIADGMDSVCQQIQAVTPVHRKGEALDVPATGPALSDPDEVQVGGGPAPLGAIARQWTFVNESRYGYGAMVSATHNSWLRLGRLVSFPDEQGRQHALVGVVRNIKRVAGDSRHVGIEVLSRKAIKVTLRNLDEKLRSRDSAADDAVSAGPLTQSGAFPFAAIYLPRDEARDMPSTLLVPLVEYIAGADFELVSEPHTYRIRLGQVIEQRDDWVWVKVQVLEKGTG